MSDPETGPDGTVPSPDSAAPIDAAPAIDAGGVAAWRKSAGWLPTHAKALCKDHARPPESFCSHAIAEFIVIAIVATILFISPPFAMEEVARQQAALIMQRVMAASDLLAGSPDDDRSPHLVVEDPDQNTTAGQRAVTVVRMDQAWLETTMAKGDKRPAWPAPVNDVERLIGKVISAHPRVIFIDLAFPVAPREISADGAVDRTGAAKEIGKYLANLQPTMPVLVGEVVDSDLIDDDPQCGNISYLDRSALADARITDPLVQKALNAGSTHVSFVDILQGRIDDGGYQLSPLRLGPSGGCTLPPQERPWLAAPALAVFKAYVDGCSRSSPRGSPCANPQVHKLADSIDMIFPPGGLVSFGPDQNKSNPELTERATGTLGVLWGLRLSPFMQASLQDSDGGDHCASQLTSSRLHTVAVLFHNAINSEDSDLNTSRCLYINNISGADILSDRIWTLPKGRHVLASTMLHDRAVIIGATVPQARDSITSPVNGDVAGVYLHAAALENLLSAGKDIHSEAAGGAWQTQMIALVGVVFIRLLVYLVTREPWHRCTGRWQTIRQLAWMTLQYLLIPGVLFTVTLIVGGLALFKMTSLTLPNMAGPLLLMALSVVEITQEMVREALAYSLSGMDEGHAPNPSNAVGSQTNPTPPPSATPQ